MKHFLHTCYFLLILSQWVICASTHANDINKPTTKNSTPDPSRIQLGAVKAAVVELETGDLLYSKNADWVTPIASITKLMTAVVVVSSDQPLDEWIRIPKPDLNTKKNTYSRIRVGSELKRRDLLRLALMSSENLAAYTLSSSFAGGVDAFVDQMNLTAKTLGMKNTRFVDSSGLSSGNVSTASDLVRLVIAATEYDTIREFSTTSKYTARFRNPRYTLGYGNTNRLVRRNNWDIQLSKTGYITEAGRCLVLTSAFDNKQVGIVLLDAYGKLTPIGDAGRIKRWLTTGHGGRISGTALQYSLDKSKKMPQP